MLAVRIDYHFRSIIYLLLKLYYSFELKLSHNHDSVDSIFRKKLLVYCMNIETFHGGPLGQPREDSHGIHMVIPMRIPRGIPTGFLWEWDGNGN